MLGTQQRQSLFYFLDTLTLVCSDCIKIDQTDEIQERMHLAIVLMERDFPMCIQVSTYNEAYYRCGLPVCVGVIIVAVCFTHFIIKVVIEAMYCTCVMIL